MKSWTRQLVGLALLVAAVLAIAAFTDTRTPEEPYDLGDLVGELLAPPAHAGPLCNNPGCNNWDPHSCCFGTSNECDSVYLPGGWRS